MTWHDYYIIIAHDVMGMMMMASNRLGHKAMKMPLPLPLALPRSQLV